MIIRKGGTDNSDATTVKFLEWIGDFKGGKFHEEVGRLLIDMLADEFEKQNQTLPFPIRGLMKAAGHILHADAKLDDKPIEPTLCLHSFVSSFLDADRIDFVRRDTETSGLLRSSVDYGRLLRFMELRPVNLGDPGHLITQDDSESGRIPHLIVMPGKRAHGDTEKVLMERFQDYLYIAAHHRVHLGDELLARCIGILLHNKRLTEVVQTLLNLSHPKAGGDTASLEQDANKFQTRLYLCSKFDDAWLEDTLRSFWLEVMEKKITLETKERYLLIAHIHSGGTVKSAFRSEADFQEYADSRIEDENLQWYRDIQNLFLSSDTHTKALDKLNTAATYVKDNKLEWEDELFEEFDGHLILVGDLVSKLRTGFPPISRMISDRMEDLLPTSDFLSSKLRKALVFNVWFDRALKPRKNAILNSVCAKLKKAFDQKAGLLEQLSKEQEDDAPPPKLKPNPPQKTLPKPAPRKKGR